MDTMGALGLGIVLTLKDQVSAGLDRIRQKMAGFSGATQDMIKNFDDGAKQLLGGMASIVMGVKTLSVVKNVFSSSFSTVANFEQAMARVKAVSGATGEAFEALRKQAEDLGRETQFSASQAANAQELLARAGFNYQRIIKSMPSLLNMAAAEGMDIANAADIASNVLRSFGLQAEDMKKVADILAATSSSTNTSIATLGESFKYVSSTAHALRIPIEEVASIIGVLGNAGIKASQSGTYLRGALNQLSKPSKSAQGTLKKLGIRLINSEGELLSFDEIFTQFSQKMKGMTGVQRLNIFGEIFDTRAATGMLAVLEQFEAGALSATNNILNNLDDNAHKMAQIMNDTAQGAMLRLESATEGLRIAIGNHLLPVYTKAIDKMAEFKGWLTQQIEAHPIFTKTILGVIGAFTTLAATVLIAVGALATVGGSIKLWKNVKPLITLALNSIRTQAVSAMGALKGMTAPVTALIILAGALYYAWQKNFLGIRDFVRAISEGFKIMLGANKDGITEVSDMTYEALRRAGLWDFALMMGKIFWRIRQFVEGFMEGLKDAWNTLKSVFNWVAEIFEPVLDRGGELLRFLGILNPLTKTQSNTWRLWGQVLGRIVPIILSVIAAFKGASIIVGIIKTITSAIALSGKVLLAHPVIAIITAVIVALILLYNHWDEVKEAFAKGVNFIRNVFRNIGRTIREAVTVAVNWVKSKWQAVKNWWNSWTLKDIFAPLINFTVRVKNIVTQKWENFKKWISNLEVSDFFQPVINFAENVKKNVSDIWERFTAWWSENMKLSNIFEALLNCVDEVIGKLKGKWEDFKIWLKNLFSFNLFSSIGSPEYKTNAKVTGTPEYHIEAMNSTWAPPSPLEHAEGGIFSQPHLGLVAEAGTEAIIPLEDKSKGIPLLLRAAKELGMNINNPVQEKYVEKILPQIIYVSPEIYEIPTPQFNPKNLMKNYKVIPPSININVSAPVNDSQVIRENNEIITNNVEKFVPISTTHEIIRENNNKLVEKIVPEYKLLTVSKEKNIDGWEYANGFNLYEKFNDLENKLLNGIFTIPEPVLNVNITTPETVTEKITNEVEKLVPVESRIETTNNFVERFVPQLISQPQVINNSEIIKENLTRESNEIIRENNNSVEKFIPEYKLLTIPEHRISNGWEYANSFNILRKFDELEHKLLNTKIEPPLNVNIVTPEAIKETMTYEIEKAVPIISEKEITREYTNNSFEKVFPQVINVPTVTKLDVGEWADYYKSPTIIERKVPEYQLLTNPEQSHSNGWDSANNFNFYEKFDNLLDKFLSNVIDFNSIAENSFQRVINALGDFRLEQPQNNSPATKYLIQQNQNQAAMNGAATVQAIQQTNENIVKVNNNFDVHIKSEPINVNLDGERLYTHVARFTERHTLREGGGGRL